MQLSFTKSNDRRLSLRINFMEAKSINFNLVSLNIGERKAYTVVLFTDQFS